MTPTIETDTSRRQQIEQCAYHLYEQRGCQPGHELEDWLEAEKQLVSAGGNASSPNSISDEEEAGARPAGPAKRPSRNSAN
jgi:hypothetical protein